LRLPLFGCGTREDFDSDGVAEGLCGGMYRDGLVGRTGWSRSGRNEPGIYMGSSIMRSVDDQECHKHNGFTQKLKVAGSDAGRMVA
jgi:hypothetical protein